MDLKKSPNYKPDVAKVMKSMQVFLMKLEDNT